MNERWKKQRVAAGGKRGWGQGGDATEMGLLCPKAATIQRFIRPQDLWVGCAGRVDRLTAKLRN